MKQRSVRGLRGILMQESISGPPLFRVYTSDDKSTFVDYPIFHGDMAIIIDDADAFAKYPTDEEPYLDYSNETLGIDETP